MSKMTLKTEGDTHIIVTRRFAAPPEAVYRAHTDPKLIQKWLLGPEGWTMPVCINEAKPGGKFRYEWTHGKAALIAMNRPDQLRFHLSYAVQNGVKKEELIEVITHLAFYSGWPNAMSAIMVAKEAFSKA